MKRITFLLSLAVLAAACAKPQPQAFHVIPMPADVTLSDGAFCVKGAEVKIDPALDDASQKAVGRFVSALETATGKPVKSGDGGFLFSLNPNLAAEQYAIHVTPEGATVEASALNGFVYACETLKQMLPAAIYGDKPVKADWVLPCVEILDQPRFGYRGMHLDVSRHFWSVDEVKRYLDVMSVYKLNRLHWHLTDDQGWRVEIKAYPKLTEISAWRNGTVIKKDWGSNDGIRYGGFYTQEQLKEVVAYAAERGITVIPEIDLPGHMQAALAAYPNLGCTGGPYEVSTTWGIKKEVLCAGKEATFTFLEDILTELTDIFPSEYIHIGGDECPRQRWKECPDCQQRIAELGIKSDDKHSAEDYLQNYVTARIQAFLNSKGRKIIGWDEILEGKLAEGATVMSWRGVKGGLKAARMGYDVIMSPNTYMYFDYYQSADKDKEPLAIGNCLPLEKVYSYEPYTDLPAEACPHILGVQANLWTEFIGTNDYLEYMMLPRAAALSEVQWSPAAAKDWESFRVRIKAAPAVYAILGYNFRPLDF
jgi:hexosaminidase